MKMWALLYIFILFYDDIRVVMICLLKPSGCDFEVSLHCKACEGKVRKRISKMEGESGQSIDSFGVTK